MLDRLRNERLKNTDWDGKKVLVPKIVVFTSTKPYTSAFNSILSALSI